MSRTINCRHFGAVKAIMITASVAVMSACVQIPVQEPPPLRPLFGDLHLHTSYSVDAFVIGRNRIVDPDAAYRFAKGEPLTLYGYTVKRTWPLDFLAVTDHPENLAFGQEVIQPGSAHAGTEMGRRILQNPDGPAAVDVVMDSYGRELDAATMGKAWRQTIAAANQNNEPGRFTALIGFEWASQSIGAEGQILGAVHRNVIFKGDAASAPFTMFLSKQVEDLWAYLEGARRAGFESLSITNHPGASQGHVFRLDGAGFRSSPNQVAQTWLRNEPASEMVTAALSYETTPTLSPGDDLATTSAVGLGSAVRDAWGRSLAAAQSDHPFRFGVVGTTDCHFGLSLADQSAVTVTPISANVPAEPWPSTFRVSAGGITGVWASSNTRAAIFEAIKRKETYATSGTRLSLRLFGSWRFPPRMLSQANWPVIAYQNGTPMGGYLPPRPSGQSAPQLVISVQKAPEGERLRRIQIIKLTAQDHGYGERIFDLPLAAKADPTSPRDVEAFDVVWSDPEFAAARSSAYYLRVVGAPRERSVDALSPPGVASRGKAIVTDREMGWSSPIWYVASRQPRTTVSTR